MNYKRGALRAWLVLSLIWIASTFVATWAVQNERQSQAIYSIDGLGNVIKANMFDQFDKEGGKSKNTVMLTPNGNRALLPSTMPFIEKRAALKRIDLNVPSQATRKILSVKTLLIAFSFPLFSLALGFAFLWVWRGFTK